jgi:hypothetical protein
MRDYLNLESAPYNEECIQVTDKKPYIQEMIEECRKYKTLLTELFPIPSDIKENTYFTIKTFPHDFGSYKEVCIIFDDENEKSCNFAYYVENNLPSNWNYSSCQIITFENYLKENEENEN